MGDFTVQTPGEADQGWGLLEPTELREDIEKRACVILQRAGLDATWSNPAIPHGEQQTRYRVRFLARHDPTEWSCIINRRHAGGGLEGLAVHILPTTEQAEDWATFQRAGQYAAALILETGVQRYPEGTGAPYIALSMTDLWRYDHG